MSLLPGRFYLDNFFDDFTEDKKLINNMNCDIYEEGGKYNIVIDIPGFDKKDININVEDGYLTIEATRNVENDNEDKHYIKRERFYGSFKRQFYIGDIDHESIEAEFKEGTLKVTVPKIEENKTKKSIEIK